MTPAPRHAELHAVLDEARTLGFLGPGPITTHLTHAAGFLDAVEEPPRRALDLGSGGGIPGLVLAQSWPASEWVLLDASERRTSFLSNAVARLGLQDRVTVHRGRAEEAGRVDALRGRFDLVTARSFAVPAVTAECGAPFLAVGGLLLVSEPPESADRWPRDGLTIVGLDLGPVVDGDGGRVQVLVAVAACPDRYARRVGVPAKRPLF